MVPLNLILVPLTQKSDGVQFFKSSLNKLSFVFIITNHTDKKAIKVAIHKIIAEY